MANGPLEASFLEDLKQYVGFSERSTQALRQLHPVAAPLFATIVDDFYAAIQAHPGAQRAIRGGDAQVARLKRTLIGWLETGLLGPHDEDYFQARARIGRAHVHIDLPQAYMFTAMNRVRVRLSDIVMEAFRDRPDDLERISTALHQLLDLELAIMLETYREDLLAKQRNAESLATIGQFAAGIGDELRKPLNVIDSSLHLLRQELGAEIAGRPAVSKHLDRMAGEICRSTSTIAGVLDLSNNRPARRRRMSMRPLIAAAIHACTLPAAVTVEIQLDVDLRADVDAHQIQHVFTNLLTNASQAMKGSGRIAVDGVASDAGVEIRVSDDGPGVSPDVRNRIFEPLFTTKTNGNGLGLPLCRRILEVHGGTIDLEPSERGASFVLWIPHAVPLDPAPEARS